MTDKELISELKKRGMKMTRYNRQAFKRIYNCDIDKLLGMQYTGTKTDRTVFRISMPDDTLAPMITLIRYIMTQTDQCVAPRDNP